MDFKKWLKGYLPDWELEEYSGWIEAMEAAWNASAKLEREACAAITDSESSLCLLAFTKDKKPEYEAMFEQAQLIGKKIRERGETSNERLTR